MTSDLNSFLWIAASITDAACNLNGFKTLLANGFNTFFIKGNPVFSYGLKSLPKNPPDCPILWNWVFDDFILADEPLAKALRRFETSVLVNSNLWGRLFLLLESQKIFDENFKVTSVPFLIPDFNLLSCELKNFTFKVLIESFYIYIILKQNKITIISQFLVKNQKWFLLLVK